MSDAHIVAVIDIVQEFNKSVVSTYDIKAPCLNDYPPMADLLHPIMLTSSEGVTFGRPGANYLSMRVVCRLLYLPVEQGFYGDTMLKIHQVMDDLFRHYTTDTSYEIKGLRVLQKQPVKIEISGGEDAFDLSGYQLINYPLRSQLWHHGCELRFSVETDLAENC